MSLLLALFEEHKQRTGHDFTKRDDQRVWCCTVCNALSSEKRREDEEDAKQAESDAANSANNTTSRTENNNNGKDQQ